MPCTCGAWGVSAPPVVEADALVLSSEGGTISTHHGICWPPRTSRLHLSDGTSGWCVSAKRCHQLPQKPWPPRSIQVDWAPHTFEQRR